ncbi:hypothetical protein M0R45_001924 [Rubus argutus]|uniref:DUF4218 domain-containing protein n=1 Tax=Rubus argutus TaxID=59490 RepID=A0AAW1VKV3_RUBAR
MYPIERNLGDLKGYVRNRACPEGSIAEGYIAEESLTFCSMLIWRKPKQRKMQNCSLLWKRCYSNCMLHLKALKLGSVVHEVSVFDREMINKLTSENEQLKVKVLKPLYAYVAPEYLQIDK